MKYYKLCFIFMLFFLSFGCTDDTLDPLKFNEIGKGSIITLRDASFDRLFEDDYYGGVDVFNLLADNSSKEVSLIVDFVSENPSDLKEVEFFVIAKDKSRTKIKSVPASEFKSGVTGTNFSRANIKFSFSDIFTKSKYSICDLKPSNSNLGVLSGITIEADLLLTNGKKVSSSSVVNSSLSESSIFYPAHSVKIMATGPNVEPIKKTIKSGESVGVNFDELLTEKVAGMTYSWVSDNNENVSGNTSSGTTNEITDVLTKSIEKKQVVQYTVTPTLPNGCNGNVFTVRMTVL